MKNLTFYSAPLTEPFKKNVARRWNELKRKFFEELKSKILALEILGTHKMFWEMFMITDSSDPDGGSTLFQWQSWDPRQVPQKVPHLVQGRMKRSKVITRTILFLSHLDIGIGNDLSLF